MIGAERFVTVCVILLLSLLWSGCAPSAGGYPGLVASSSQGSSNESPGVAGSAESATPSPGGEQPGQSAPGGAAQDSSPTAAPPNTAPGSAEAVVYQDARYHFSLTYPGDFVLGELADEQWAALEPSPVAGLTLMNPETAASAIVEQEPPDLEVRIFPALQSQSLEEWLRTHRLLPADGTVNPQPYHSASTSGLEVCSATLLVPNCFYFFAGEQWVYALIPMTQAGETAMGTFAVTE